MKISSIKEAELVINYGHSNARGYSVDSDEGCMIMPKNHTEAVAYCEQSGKTWADATE